MLNKYYILIIKKKTKSRALASAHSWSCQENVCSVLHAQMQVQVSANTSVTWLTINQL